MTKPKTSAVTWDAVLARRIERHGLAQPVPNAQLANQVGLICGAHAQVISAAEISVGLRVAGSTRQQIQDALWKDHTLIKTFGSRGTVHLLHAEDLPIWTGALSALPSVRTMHNKERILTDEQIDIVVAAIDEVLQDAELTIDELTDAIVSIVGSWAGDKVMDAFQDKWPRWRDATTIAANRGVLCFGTNQGRKVRYTNPRRWLPDFEPAPEKAAFKAVVQRYLYAYGPSTPAHFARWMSIPVTRATKIFDALAGDIEPVDIEGDRGWVVTGDSKMPDTPAQGVRLLPYFDAYGVGCHPREKIFPGKAAERALARTQVGNFPVLLDGGSYAKLLAASEFLTMDKAGPMATAQTGQIGFADGAPVLVSAEMPLTEADGKVGSGTNNRGQAVCVYRPGWFVGYRRRIAVSVDYLPYYDSYQLTATVRLAFANFDTDVSATLFNLAV